MFLMVFGLSLRVNGHEKHISGREIEVISVYYKKEVIEGKTFIYREDVVNGKKKQSWTINGRSVDEEAFEEELLDAEKELRRKERLKEEGLRVREQERQLSTLRAIAKKQLELHVVAVEIALHKFDTVKLKPFLLSEELQKEIDQITQELLPQAKKMLSLPENSSLEELNHSLSQLEGSPERLGELFYIAVNDAIQKCDDTRLLKELLEVIS